MAQRVFPVDAVTGAPSYSGRAIRQSLLAPLLAGATAGRPLGAISGVRPGTSATTVTVTSMVWSVAPHAGVLDVQAAVEAGPYGYAIDAAVTGAVTAAHATLARWDGIYVQLSDPAESDGTSVPGVAAVYVAGTAAASPAMPTQPARSMLLARIVVPASGGGSPSVVWLAPTLMVAGMSDTGWLAITPAGGWTANNSPAVRVRNGVASLRGSLQATLGASGAALVLGSLPAGTYPATPEWRTVTNISSVPNTGLGVLSIAGAITVYPAGPAGIADFSLSSFSGYSIN